MIRARMCLAIEKALRMGLTSYPDSGAMLMRHQGKTLALSMQPGGTLVLVIEADGIRVLPQTITSVTAHISGAMHHVVRVLMQGSSSITGSGLVMMGDVVWAAEWLHELADMMLDWEAILGGVIGSFGAQGVARGVSFLRGSVGHVPRTLQAQAQVFLQQESGMLPVRAEIEEWIQQVRLLQFDVERLEARFKHVCLREEPLS